MANDVLKTLIAEAYGEGPEGMRRVAETILNRAAIRGLTPEQVVRQPYQYTGLHQPGADVKKLWNDEKALEQAQAAWDLAIKPGDPTGGADHYYATGTISEPYWAKSMRETGDYGGH
jgi:spore germination cell wall hydrolase CwlJ-like protein